MPEETETQDVGTGIQEDSAPEMTDEQMGAYFPDDKTEVDAPVEGQQEPPADSATEGGEVASGTQQAEPVIDLNGEKVPLKDVLAWKESHGKVTQEFQSAAKMRADLEPLVQFKNAMRSNRELGQAVAALADKAGDPATLKKVMAVLNG